MLSLVEHRRWSPRGGAPVTYDGARTAALASRIVGSSAAGARTRDLLTASHYLPVEISIFSAIVSTSVSTFSRDFRVIIIHHFA